MMGSVNDSGRVWASAPAQGPVAGLYSAARGKPHTAPRSPLRGLRPSGDDP